MMGKRKKQEKKTFVSANVPACELALELTLRMLVPAAADNVDG